MKKLTTFCKKTGRRLSTYANRLFGKLIRHGTLALQVSISIPLFLSVKIDYRINPPGR